MPYLILMGVVLGFTTALLGWRALISRGRSTATTPLAMIGMAAGEPEAHLWSRSLKQAGIWSRMQTTMATGYESFDYWEFWVREKDAQRAREILGLGD